MGLVVGFNLCSKPKNGYRNTRLRATYKELAGFNGIPSVCGPQGTEKSHAMCSIGLAPMGLEKTLKGSLTGKHKGIQKPIKIILTEQKLIMEQVIKGIIKLMIYGILRISYGLLIRSIWVLKYCFKGPKRGKEDLVKTIRKWLGKDGIKFFREIKEKYGCINACWDEGGIPHSVHFREGMQVRNFMRTSGFCDDWSAHDFDNNWVGLILKAIE